ncbi:MAG: VWA domain-containing protein, partial [Planctomycetota bacterium]
MIAELSSTTLRWDALPPLWVVVLLIVPAVMLAVRFIYRREPGAQGTPLRMSLGMLRVLAVLLVLGALFGPYSETVEGEISKRTLVVAIDTSRSMSLADQYQRNQKLAGSLAAVTGVDRDRIARLSRLDIARAVIGGDEQYLATLLDTFDLQLFTFDDGLKADFVPIEGESRDDALARLSQAISNLKAEGGVTRIGSAIRTLVRRLEARNEPVAGIVLFTDGRHTGGAPEPVAAAQRAADRGREGI